MSLDTGTMSFRAFYLRDDMPVNPSGLLAAMECKAAPDLAATVTQKTSGWVGPAHLLDRDLSEEHCLCGNWISVQLMQAERKVPESLLKAACQREEAAEMQARGCDVLPRHIRAEVKARVSDALRASAQPSLSGIGVWVDVVTRVLLAEATTDGKIDLVSPSIKEVLGCLPICATPETAAIKLMGVNANDLAVVRTFGNDGEAVCEVSLGREFLTWLFFNYEKEGGDFRLDVHGDALGYMLEGPLTFYREGLGAHEVNIRKGNPLNSREAMACLSEGKLLGKAKFVMVHADKTWVAMVDETFCFQSVKLPKEENLGDRYGRQMERTMNVVTFLTAWFGLYRKFLVIRSNPAQWNGTVAEIRAWVTGRIGGTV